MYDLAHVAEWEPAVQHARSKTRFLGWICYHAYPAPLTTAREKLDDLDHDLSHASVQGVAII